MDLSSESHYKEYGLFTFMEGRKCISLDHVGHELGNFLFPAKKVLFSLRWFSPLARKRDGSSSSHGLYHGCSEHNGKAGNQVQLVFPPSVMVTGPAIRQ